jgi:STE24 endopeptidase
MQMAGKTMIEQYGFNIELQKKARKYFKEQLSISMLRYVFLFATGFIVLGLGISTGLRSAAFFYASVPWMATALYSFVGFVCLWLVSLPFDYYLGYVVDHKFGLSTQTFRSWIWDQTKGLILSMAIFILAVQGIYFALSTFPIYWWVVVWIIVSLAIVIMSYIAPKLIMPLFFKYHPLQDQQLIERLTNLAQKARVKVIGVFEMKAGIKTKRAIGALTGISNTRRIILSDTLLENYIPDEIEGVIGHELGHNVFHHIGKMMIISNVLMLVAFYIANLVLRASVGVFGFSGIDDIASLPLIAMTLGFLFTATTPFLNALSRHYEEQADQYELEIVNKPDAFITCMVKLCNQNLGYADPHSLVEFLFYDHPSAKHRIQHAMGFIKSKKTN